MHKYLVEMLVCPACRGELDWVLNQQDGNRIESGGARCLGCGAVYPIREGIGLFLTPDLPREDLWEDVDSHIQVYLNGHPEVERQLMDSPLEELAPADQFFRAMVLEERGRYAQAKAAKDTACEGLYTSEYLACSDNMLHRIIERLEAAEGPVVDLASGRGYLVEEMARRLDRLIVASDFSPRVLRRDRRWLKFLGLYDRVSLLAFDARRTPFKDGAIGTLTTYLGLPNISDHGSLLGELRRIVSGSFLAISIFYPGDDGANAAAIREAGLSGILIQNLALESFASAGWQVEITSACAGKAHPTPRSVLLDGAGIDGLPVAETELHWCLLAAV